MTIDEIVAQLQGIVDAAEGRDLTDEEAQRYQTLEGDLQTARRSAEIRARQTAYNTPANAPVQTTAPTGAEQLRAFGEYLRTGKLEFDGVLTRAQSEGIGSAGGYLVPDEFRNDLVQRMLAYGGLATVSQIVTTSDGRPLDFPTVDDTSNTGEIIAEAATFANGADIVFGTKTLGAYKYGSGGASNLPVKVSYELIQDGAFNIVDYLTSALSTRIGRAQAAHWVSGTGSGQPQGLLTPKSAFGNMAGTTAPTYGELVDTVHALDPAYRAGAKWLFNDSTLGAIRKIVDGNSRPIWDGQAQSGMGNMPGGMLLGYPVVIDQAMPSIAASGATKCIAFGDFGQSYLIRRVKDVMLVVLDQLYAPNGQVGYFAWARADGCVRDANAYVILASKA